MRLWIHSIHRYTPNEGSCRTHRFAPFRRTRCQRHGYRSASLLPWRSRLRRTARQRCSSQNPSCALLRSSSSSRLLSTLDENSPAPPEEKAPRNSHTEKNGALDLPVYSLMYNVSLCQVNRHSHSKWEWNPKVRPQYFSLAIFFLARILSSFTTLVRKNTDQGRGK